MKPKPTNNIDPKDILRNAAIHSFATEQLCILPMSALVYEDADAEEGVSEPDIASYIDEFNTIVNIGSSDIHFSGDYVGTTRISIVIQASDRRDMPNISVRDHVAVDYDDALNDAFICLMYSKPEGLPTCTTVVSSHSQSAVEYLEQIVADSVKENGGRQFEFAQISQKLYCAECINDDDQHNQHFFYIVEEQ